MHVDAARQDQGTRGVNLPPAAQAAAQLNDYAVPDAHIALARAARRHNGPAADDQIALHIRNLPSPQPHPDLVLRRLTII